VPYKQEIQHQLGRNLMSAVNELIRTKKSVLFLSALENINKAVSQGNFLSFWFVFDTILPQLWRVEGCCLGEDGSLNHELQFSISAAIKANYNYVININQFDPNWISYHHATDASQTHAATLFNTSEDSESRIDNIKTNQQLLNILKQPSKYDQVRRINSYLEKYAWSKQGKQLQALVVDALPLTESPSNRF